jgi:hypothetical protein
MRAAHSAGWRHINRRLYTSLYGEVLEGGGRVSRPQASMGRLKVSGKNSNPRTSVMAATTMGYQSP